MTRPLDRGLADELQAELRDLLCLAVVGDHLRWVVGGDEALELVDWLSEAAPRWRGWAEQVARELVRLGVAPDGRVRSLAKDIRLNWVPDGWLGADEARRLVASRLGVVAGWAEFRRSLPADPNSVHVLDAVCVGLAAQARERRAIVSSAAHGLEHERAAADTEPDEGRGSA
jgi:starvation-inducible DNA-binding protein